MSRRESDREDLLREATALVERAELRVEGFVEPIIMGFRSSGAASIFFGADPVFQFNSRGEFRRGYRQGELIKAERGRLAVLHRQRSDREVRLVRREMTAEETTEHLHDCWKNLAALKNALAAGGFVVVGQAPRDVDVLSRIKDWLETLASPISIAASPHAR